MIIGDCSPRVSRVDLESGEPSWSTQIPRDGQIHADPLVSEDEVLIGIDVARPGALVSLDLETGAVHRSIAIASGVSHMFRAGSMLILVHGDGSVAGLAPPGVSGSWHRRRLPGPVGEQRPAEMIEASIYWSRSARALERIDPQTGTTQDSIELASEISSAPSGNGNTIAIGRRGAIEITDSGLQPLRSIAVEGKPLWVHLRGNELLALIETERTLALVLHKLHDDTTEEVARARFEETQLSTPRPLITNGGVIFGTEDGQLIFAALKQNESWVLELGATPRGLALNGNQLLVGTREGRLVSVRLVD